MADGLGVEIRVVKIGTCTLDPGNVMSALHVHLRQQLGVGGGSSVTVLRDGEDGWLLVDTGFEREGDLSVANQRANARSLRAHLELAGVRPKQVSKVFVTHFHRDHTGGLEQFRDATWYAHRLALDKYWGPDKGRFVPLDDGDEVVPRATVIPTPGHTLGHCSILWTSEHKAVRVAISGDAIVNLAWLQSGRIWQFNRDLHSVESTQSSIALLLGLSDIVIPGHGEPFFTTTALELARQRE
jgi:glyoxylase-like metal-dependent hydrolase (beta-lactamase superfamily II)